MTKTKKEDDILGIVLSGGRSSRMGRDKGLCIKDGYSFVSLAYDKLSFLCSRVLVSINRKQYNKYKFLFPKEDIVFDTEDCRGPLGGLISVYNSIISTTPLIRAFFVLACDMIYIELPIIERIIDLYKSSVSSDYNLFLYRVNGLHKEPLCAIYKIDFLDDIKGALKKEQGSPSKAPSFKSILSLGKALYLELSIDDARYFKSVNRPEDFC